MTHRGLVRLAVPGVILAGSLVASLAIYYGLLGSAWVEVVAAGTADMASRTLNLLGASTTANGTTLYSSGFAVSVVAECTALGPLVLFTGAVAAYPSSWRDKGVGVALGLVVLNAINVLRIVSLFWIGSAFPEYLDVAHLIVWQTALVLSAIILWLWWAERVARARRD